MTPTRAGWNEQILESGYLYIWLNKYCFAQVPQGFVGDKIPDEYIFHAEWNRERINKYWKARQP